MSSYYYKRSLQKRVRRWERTHKGLLIVGLSLFFIASVLGVYFWQQNSVKQSPAVITPVKLGIYSGNPKREYTNEIFSFTTTVEWKYIREASTPPTKYVYVNDINGIVQHELTIYVDGVPERPVGYIIPVNILNGKIVTEQSSPKCTDRSSNPNNLINASYKGVKYICDFTNSNEITGAGVVGGSYDIPLYSSKGKLTTVGLYFTNHGPGYKPEVFSEVLSNFKLR